MPKVCGLEDGERAAGYVQIFFGRQKVASVPVFLNHYVLAALFQGRVQGFVRDLVYRFVRSPKKGAVPRIKVSNKP